MRIFIIIGLAVALTACVVPRTVTKVPGISGTVLDAKSGEPLADVTISEQSDSYPAAYTPLTTITKSDGAFNYPAIEDGTSLTFMAPGAGFPIYRMLRFEKEGFYTLVCQTNHFSLFSKPVQLDVRLIRLSKLSKLPLAAPRERDERTSTACEDLPNDSMPLSKSQFLGSK